jgi:hypothetical protein
MIFKVLIITMCIWIAIYTASYAVFEHGSGNKAAMASVFALCFLVCFFTVVAVII